MSELNNNIQNLEQSDLPLSGKQITKIIFDFDQDQYLINMAYATGKNPTILLQGAENAKQGKDPNSVVPLPFGRKTINDVSGYAYKPGNVVYKYIETEGTEEEKENIKEIEQILIENDQGLESAEVFRDALIKGEGAELVWATQEGGDEKIKFAKVSREKCIFEYHDSLKEDTLKWAIRFYKFIEVLSNGEDAIKHRADVYDNDFVHFYEWQEKKDLTNRDQQKSQNRFDGKNKRDYVYVGSIRHPFSKVPLHPFNINEDKLGVFQASIPIIDKLDDLGSDSIANAIGQFNDTILTLSKKVDKKTVDKIKESKVIDDLGGKDEGNFAEFMQRNLDIEGTLEATKVFERWYYTLTGVPNINDEKFNVKSGIAIAYALVPFENAVTTMEIYFSKGLLYRLDLINNARNFFDPSKQSINAELKWDRNIPFDLKERVDIVKAIKESGIMSDETLLKMFPKTIVADVDEEIKRKLAESKAKIDIVPEQPEKDGDSNNQDE